MPLDPRSSPQDVLAFFAMLLTDGALAEALRILRADPNWAIHVLSSPTTCDLTLLYRPVGTPSLSVRLERTASPADPGVWHMIA